MFDARAKLPALPAGSPPSCHELTILASLGRGEIRLAVAQNALKPTFFLDKAKGMYGY
jgi:hypothetical protein